MPLPTTYTRPPQPKSDTEEKGAAANKKWGDWGEVMSGSTPEGKPVGLVDRALSAGRLIKRGFSARPVRRKVSR